MSSILFFVHFFFFHCIWSICWAFYFCSSHEYARFSLTYLCSLLIHTNAVLYKPGLLFICLICTYLFLGSMALFLQLMLIYSELVLIFLGYCLQTPAPTTPSVTSTITISTTLTPSRPEPTPQNHTRKYRACKSQEKKKFFSIEW